MNWLKKMYTSLLILSVMFLMVGQNVLAQETDETGYTYTVRLSAGNQGELTGEGITVVRGDDNADPEGTSVRREGNMMVVSGLQYDDKVYIIPGDAAKATDERYSIRGVRRSGRDNSEAVQSTGPIASDMDYVIAYRVSGNMVRYTVQYLDAAGNDLLPSDTYYGNPGERQYVSGAGAAGAGAGAAGADDTAAGADAGVGGDVAAVPDEEVPLDEGPEDLVDLDDEEVPLANMNQERPGKIMGYLPVYIGIGLVAAIALVATAVYLRKRRKVPAKEIVERIRNNEVK